MEKFQGLDGLAIGHKLLGQFTYSARPEGRFSIVARAPAETDWELLRLLDELYPDSLPSIVNSIEFDDQDQQRLKAVWDQYRDDFAWTTGKAHKKDKWKGADDAFLQVRQRIITDFPGQVSDIPFFPDEVKESSDRKFAEWARLSHRVSEADLCWFKVTRAFHEFQSIPGQIKKLCIALQSKLDDSKGIETELFGD
jgi:hypothetical protein